MRRVVVHEFVTLDGVMQGPGGAREDRRGGFKDGGWSSQHGDDAEGRFIFDTIANSGGFLLGRRTYDIWAPYWPKQPADNELAAMMNRLPKYVVSTTLKEPLRWNNSKLINGDVAVEVAKLKKQAGQDLLVIGSGELVHILMKHGLADQYNLMVHPVVLGRGMRLFREGNPKTWLRLTDTKTTSSGVVILTYAPERLGSP